MSCSFKETGHIVRLDPVVVVSPVSNGRVLPPASVSVINGPAQREVRTDRLTLRVWDADEIVNRLLTAYDRLPDDMRARIPLKQARVLDEETG